MRAAAWFLSLLMVPAVALAATRGEGDDRALVTFEGRVVAVESVTGPDGETWIDAFVERRGTSAARVRVAPSAVLEVEGFSLVVGEVVKVRAFSDELPFSAQQIRSSASGQVLRLRCLHGEPLWDVGRPDRGLGPSSVRRGATGGFRRRGER